MINSKTCLVGLLGQSVQHSISPAMHNAALAEMDLNWSYLAFPCEKKNLPEVLKGLRALNCRGLNVTIPHKESVANLCKKLTSVAEKVQAVNTLIPNKTEGWIGTNTDIEGFLAPLEISENKWENLNAVVIGCGGSARAVVAGLQTLNLSKISVIGRNKDSLSLFIQNFKTKFKSPENKTEIKEYLINNSNIYDEIRESNLIVNTTPIGMKQPQKIFTGDDDDMPLGKEIWQQLKKNTTLYDLVYTPRPTPWLAWGLQQGYQCIDGLEMLIQQGAASLRLWSGCKDIPVHAMRKAAKAALELK